MTQTSNTKQDAAKRNPGFGIYAFLCEDYQDRAINEDAARRCREWEEAISSEPEAIRKVSEAVKTAAGLRRDHPVFDSRASNTFSPGVLSALEAARITRIEIKEVIQVRHLEALRLAGWNDPFCEGDGAVIVRSLPDRHDTFGDSAESEAEAEGLLRRNPDSAPGDLLKRVLIDFENNSDWWEWGGRELWNSERNSLIFRTGVAEHLRTLAESLPFWNDGPDFAKNPLLFQDYSIE